VHTAGTAASSSLYILSLLLNTRFVRGNIRHSSAPPLIDMYLYEVCYCRDLRDLLRANPFFLSSRFSRLVLSGEQKHSSQICRLQKGAILQLQDVKMTVNNRNTVSTYLMIN